MAKQNGSKTGDEDITKGQEAALARAKANPNIPTVVNPDTGEVVPVFTDATDAIMPLSRELLAEIAKTHEAEKLHVLKEGEALRGIVLGTGPDAELIGLDGNAQRVKTWRIQSDKPGLIVRLLGSYQLDAELPLLIGRDVIIGHNGQKNTRHGKRVNDLTIWKPRGTVAEMAKPQLPPAPQSQG